MSLVKELAVHAKTAAGELARLQPAAKNQALNYIADQLIADSKEIIQANALDLQKGKKSGLPEPLLDRLALDQSRLNDIAEGIHQIAALKDPIGEVIESWTRPNGLKINKVRVPIGVVGIIYEGRPNVTVDAAALCLKAGSAVILRGSSTALNSNRALVKATKKALAKTNVPTAAVQLVDSTDRADVNELLKLKGLIDLVIPRGGAGLIQSVVQNATVPVIETGVGNCHIYIDQDADPQMALDILLNAKCQRYGVCNAAETLLVHQKIAAPWLPQAIEALKAKGVTVRGCGQTQKLANDVEPATESDWEWEFLAPIIAVKVVNDLNEAIAHIQRYGTGHSEAIVTDNRENADIFLRSVDAAAVYHNASTRFTDGFEFGFGAEIGISTQKLHARGPMGLKELTSYKYIVLGSGQTRA